MSLTPQNKPSRSSQNAEPNNEHGKDHLAADQSQTKMPHADEACQNSPSDEHSNSNIDLDSTDESLKTRITNPNSQSFSFDFSSTESDTRFSIGSEIARGGMGIVKRVRDNRLERDVAMKICNSKLNSQHRGVARFLREAKITSQLQHPGIVPIIDVGNLKDGRPFITMKLIEGKTLREILKQDRPQVELLEIFGHVCQALAYAHSRKVIHRDLKPENIMVGAFGEVQVMDWGLAKILEGSDVADVDEHEFAAVRARGQFEPSGPYDSKQAKQTKTGDSTKPVVVTKHGSIMGTPAYMSPEQSRGELDNLSPSSDVFSLGAIMGEILTGETPTGVNFSGENPPNPDELGQASIPQTFFPKLRDDPIQDEALANLLQRCLASQPDDRPADAQEIYKALNDWKSVSQERVRDADLARVKAETKASLEAKRRRMTMALAITMIGILLTSASVAIFGLYQRNQNKAERLRQATETTHRTIENDRKISKHLSLALDLKDEAANDPNNLKPLESALSEIQVAAALVNESTSNHFVELVSKTTTDLEERFQQVKQSVAATELRETIRTDLASAKKSESKPPAKSRYAINLGACEEYHHAFRFLDTDFSSQDSPARAAERIREEPEDFQQHLVEHLYRWFWVAEKAKKFKQCLWIFHVIDDISPNEIFRKMLHLPNEECREFVIELANNQEVYDEVMALLIHKRLHNFKEFATERDFLSRSLAQNPDSFWLNLSLADNCYKQQPVRLDLAYNYFLAARAIAPSNPATLGLGGAILVKQKRIEEALEVFDKLDKAVPNYLLAKMNLGIVHLRLNNFDTAISYCDEAIALRPKLAMAHTYKGMAYAAQEDLSEAEIHFNAAIEADPKSPLGYIRKGELLARQGDFKEAHRLFDIALLLDPASETAHIEKGSALQDAEEYEAAEKIYRKLIKLGKGTSSGYELLGELFIVQGKSEEAIIVSMEGLKYLPNNLKLYETLSNAHRANGDRANAEKYEAIAKEILNFSVENKNRF